MNEELKSWRKERGMSQQELAYKLGVSLATIYRWEAGRAAPSKLAQERLQTLGVKK